MSLRWDQATEELLARVRTQGPGVIRTGGRTQADVLRSAQAGYALLVLLPLHQEPVDSLVELRPLLTDDELAVVARALGF